MFNTKIKEIKGKYIEECQPDGKENEFNSNGDVITMEACDLVGDTNYCRIIRGLDSDNYMHISRIPYATLRALPTREYLDLVLVPILITALNHIAKTRPPNAMKAFALYLLKHRGEYETPEDLSDGTPASTNSVK
ncbi:unnamed protein product [Phyllotreta striolata]|uniref:Uncharacterized protein n=1 Tax=Phyllotreta striolata TaxID=444603 RepID=A0A9N9TQJ7_PHYSR|nr:unnamed protein product [Phyllotreta striolata]